MSEPRFSIFYVNYILSFCKVRFVKSAQLYRWLPLDWLAGIIPFFKEKFQSPAALELLLNYQTQLTEF